ncbi:hypothetical protein BO94DRAFT_539174 [Aspergillus sclerotioniger CBS 115572]|uniref:Uncharacterized protein n=1 Tax=Aspergillus sclerotioniger CBS 115572 TaxID=1450535 RepID=A0A317VH58_9EURO|nr:hypothetical protein BO94DRAFT_539174 [Aspergillus sclerotioniger CBS 115572]PWY72501.1 hypothetical protein BO94DRAFT_539174 [Aspergillus sclerotioniger CBS 115572]
MGYTFYDGTIAVIQSILNSLSHILRQAEKHPDATSLLEARLYEDMYPLTDQIRLATQFSENVAAKLTGRDPVDFEGKPTTYAECYERIDTVLEVLGKADKDVVNQQCDIVGPSKVSREMTMEVSGAVYAHTMAMPNIYFHLTTAYDILRKEGVPLGKRDYYAGFFPLS